jgi:hypothetical protein
MCEYLSLDDDSLERIVKAIYARTLTPLRNSREDSTLESEFTSIRSQIEEIKTARHHCCAWLLQILALEIHDLESASHGEISAHRIATLLQVLLRSQNRSNSSVDSRQPLLSFLQAILDVPTCDFPPISSQLILQCLEEATVPYRYGKRGQLSIYSSDPRVLRGLMDHDGKADQLGFTVVDVITLIRIIEEKNFSLQTFAKSVGTGTTITKAEMNETIKVAVAMNNYQQRLAAATHLSKAWSQLSDIMMIGNSSTILMQAFSVNTNESIQHTVDNILLPTLEVLSNIQEMILAEKIITSVMTILATLRRKAFSPLWNELQRGLKNLWIPLPLPVERYKQILLRLLQLLLRKHESSVAMKSSFDTSVYFRGMLYICLNMILVQPFHNSLSAPSISLLLTEDSDSFFEKNSILNAAQSGLHDTRKVWNESKKSETVLHPNEKNFDALRLQSILRHCSNVRKQLMVRSILRR